jgi:hypothetical protein
MCSQEDAQHILLRCPEMRTWGEELITRKWLYMNEEVAYKKILMCTNKSLMIYLGGYTELNVSVLIR